MLIHGFIGNGDLGSANDDEFWTLVVFFWVESFSLRLPKSRKLILFADSGCHPFTGRQTPQLLTEVRFLDGVFSNQLCDSINCVLGADISIALFFNLLTLRSVSFTS